MRADNYTAIHATNHVLCGHRPVGVAAQWLAWRSRLPAIVFLLAAGLIAGPLTGLIAPSNIGETRPNGKTKQWVCSRADGEAAAIAVIYLA
jgi:hypothetical protein